MLVSLPRHAIADGVAGAPSMSDIESGKLVAFESSSLCASESSRALHSSVTRQRKGEASPSPVLYAHAHNAPVRNADAK